MSDQPSDVPSGEAPRRKIYLTPERRRVLGPARSLHDEPEVQPPPKIETEPQPEAEPEETSSSSSAPAAPAVETEKRKPKRRWRFSQKEEMQSAALIIGVLILFAIVFYIGKKYERWKYEIESRNYMKRVAGEANKFPGKSAEELVEQALASERVGNWQDAIERFVAAKYKNLSYSGLLYHVGKLYYDHGAFDSADQLFERAIAFNENIDGSNYYRGMIALGHDNFPAAEHFFEAATVAAPFNADYYYSLGETLRKEHRPRDAISRYEQAAIRAGESERIVCEFKIRMAQLEAGDTATVSSELDKMQSKGPLPVDWMMTNAALQIAAGKIDNAAQIVRSARTADQSHLFGLFAACAGDRFFTNASLNYPELANACQVSATQPSVNSPNN
jgi:tetratricopeptide (TPR) repeat protein